MPIKRFGVRLDAETIADLDRVRSKAGDRVSRHEVASLAVSLYLSAPDLATDSSAPGIGADESGRVWISLGMLSQSALAACVDGSKTSKTRLLRHAVIRGLQRAEIRKTIIRVLNESHDGYGWHAVMRNFQRDEIRKTRLKKESETA